MADPTKPKPPSDPWKEAAEWLKQPAAPPVAEPTPAPASTGWGPDPWATMINAGAAQLPTGTPDWLRTVGRFAIPQNAVEAALMAATLPLGGAGGFAAKHAPKLVGPLAKKSLGALAARTGLTAGATAGAGAVTGQDPLESATIGALGRVGGEAAGALGAQFTKHVVSNRLMREGTAKLADAFKQTIGPWLPEGKLTPQRIIQAIIRDEPSQKVGLAIGEARKRLGDTPITVADLEPLLDKHGVIYAWPTVRRFPGRLGEGVEKEAGEAAGEVGRGAQDLGTVWPPIREFEKKLTPGRDIMPFGAVERPGALAPVPPKAPKRIGAGTSEGAEVAVPGAGSEAVLAPGQATWGQVDEALEKAITALQKVGVDSESAVARLHGLESLRAELASRVNDQGLSDLLKQYGRTKALRDWMWGARGATPAYGEKVAENLIGEGGNLSPAGLADLHSRFLSGGPSVARTLGDDAKIVEKALGWEAERGLERMQPGEGVKAMAPAVVSWLLGHTRVPTAEITRAAPKIVSHVPGWENAPQGLAGLAPFAARALGGQTVANVVPELNLGPAKAEAAEVPPAKLQSPYAMDFGTPPAPPVIERPPPQDVTADWFTGAAAPKGESPPDALEVSLSTSRVPGEKEPE